MVVLNFWVNQVRRCWGLEVRVRAGPRMLFVACILKADHVPAGLGQGNAL